MATSAPTKPDSGAMATSSTLSEYLHNQFETIVAHSSVKDPMQKIQVAKQMKHFIRQEETQPESKDEMFSPLIADVYLTIESDGLSHGKQQTTRNEPESPDLMSSGIQLPVIDWHQQFRKGYSIMMWVRFHAHSNTSATATDISPDSSKSADDPWVDQTNPKPQILFRFATSVSPTALGIQATLHRDTSAPNKSFAHASNDQIPCILQIKSLRPTSPSKLDPVPSLHPNSLTLSISIPAGKWTLLGIQHSFPYLKPPTLSIALDGVEVNKGEVAYPSLGGELGSSMRDNFILCNIPNGGSADDAAKGKKRNEGRYASSRLNIDKVDFAGFGLFKEIVPLLIQGIVSEHGPSNSADGVIPVVPPVVQNRDAIITNVERNAMQKKSQSGSGPFGRSTYRNKGGGSRGIGIPLSVGVMLSSDGNAQGAVLSQRLLSKLVIGLNASNVVRVGGGKVLIPVSMGCSVGLTADVPKAGIVQPKEPYVDSSFLAASSGKKKNIKSFFAPAIDQQEENVNMARCGGNIHIFTSSQEFLMQQRRNESSSSVPVPVYSLPSSLLPEARPIPSFLDAYSSLDSFGYILQAFHRSLPPPGYPHNLQSKYYQDSFDHLHDLVIFEGGAFAAHLIGLFAANISLGGKAKDEVLHSGSLHVLATLMRRVLLRAARLGMFTNKTGQDKPLWQVYGPKEKSEDELLDMYATKQSAPNHIPTLMTKACCSLIDAGCGPVQEEGRRWKRPSLSLHIRRASDIALTTIFGFAMDMDLWGNDICACASIIKEVVDRYCSEGFDSENNAEIVEKFDVGYGRMLRSEISAQHLLDNIRMRFGEEMILSKRSNSENSELLKAKVSVATSLSRLLYMLLKYSLSSKKTIPLGEHDVIAAVNALSDCQLGSIGSNAILTAVNDLLVYSETFPLDMAQGDLPESDVQAVSAILYSHHYSNVKQKNREGNLKLKAIKTDIIGRLARNLIIGQFHDVVAPLLLSRTVFTGNADSNLNCEDNVFNGDYSRYHWQHHWRIVLRLFTWLVSVAGSKGEEAAKTAGSLLLQSGEAGSLHQCLITNNRMELVQILAMPLPTATSAVPPGFNSSRDISESHLLELCYRLKTMLYLSGGLTAALLSQFKNEHIHMTRISINSISTLTNSLKTLICFTLERNYDLMTHQVTVSRQRHGNAAVVDKPDVRAALELGPPLVATMILFEEKLDGFRTRQRSSELDSWDFVEVGAVDIDPPVDEQVRALISCQEEMSTLAGILVARSMIVGGGEASTLVWRAIIASFDSCTNGLNPMPPFECVSKQVSKGIQSSRRANLLCRLSAIVLDLITSRREKHQNPWTSIELCSATARLCDLVEEKHLLHIESSKGYQGSSEGNKGVLSLDQVRLLCSLLTIMESGKENTGWCQLVLPRPPTRQSSIDQSSIDSSEILPFLNLKEYCEGLLSSLASDERLATGKIVDVQLLAEKDEIYDVATNVATQHRLKIPKKAGTSTHVASSKMLLPILQPSLRIILSCLPRVKGVAVLIHKNSDEESKEGTDSLLSVIVEELNNSLTAAIVGLAFSNARDICLNTLSVLRTCIQMKESGEDDVAAVMCRTLFLTVMNEMRIRYEGERSKRVAAELQAYDDSKSMAAKEAANARQVEALLLGDALTGPFGADRNSDPRVDQGKNDDFIVFPDDGPLESQRTSTASPRGSSTLGWNNYKGFGRALEECCKDNGESLDVKDVSANAFQLLSRYLDAWDECQLIDDEESELVELFDTKSSLENRYGGTKNVSSASAADSMTSFIELASAEATRRTEIMTSLLPFRRYNNISFAENLNWKIFMEIGTRDISCSHMFERCMADGGRDYGSRLVSVPIHPQFPRTIPKQLDHSVHITKVKSEDEQDMDFDHLNSLVQQGTLKVVDITKKDNRNDLGIDDDTDSLDGSNVLVSKPRLDSESGLLEDFNRVDDIYLDFPNKEDKEDPYSKEQERASENENHSKEDISMDIIPVGQGNHVDNDDSQYDYSMSTFANPPNISSSSLQGNYRHSHVPNTPLDGGNDAVDLHYDTCMQIKAEGNRNGTLFVTSTYLVFEYEDANGLYEGEQMAIDELKKKIESDEDDRDHAANDMDYERMIQHYKKVAAQRPKSMRWNISEMSHIYLRRYRLRDSSIELFFIPSGGDATGGPGLTSAMSSLLLDFGSGNEGNFLRDEAANSIMSRAPASTVKQWPDKSAQFLHEHLRNITIGWVKGRVSNFDYLLALNCLSGRSFNDLCQYPIFPWVLSNYKSDEIPNLNDKANYRDLSKPMGALNPDRLKEFLERFRTFDDPMIPPFMYGSHYSTSAGVVLHFLVRLHPFASLHRQLQGGHFDVADRLFSSVSRTWDMCTGQSASEVKELTPEWYCNPTFLRNINKFKLGTSQDGQTLGDVELPPWAKESPEKFVEVLRSALESDICTSMLPDWIDLIFGRKQQGLEAVEANNVFFYLTYYGSCDVASIEDDNLRFATELQIAHFGQCPMQLFWRPHVQKFPRNSPRRRLSLSEMLGVFDLENLQRTSIINRQLPFESAPISHWVHLFAPPPGPHAPLISVRFVFPDRCIAIDALGIYHFFRWAWKADMEQSDERPSRLNDLFSDRGYFVGQRELPHFRSVPRLRFSRPKPTNWKNKSDGVVVAISKCLYATRSLLVVSDGDGQGGLCFQLVDPSKCIVQGEVHVSSAHSSRISAIHMDPIGTAAGMGGAGGEVAIVGSDDGTASLWRFISSIACNLPLRPRLRFGGHRGQRISAVAVNSSMNLCATVSSFRCCIFNITNGTLLRSIAPPNSVSDATGIQDSKILCETRFVDSNSICITSSGFVVLVCESKFWSKDSSFLRNIITLQLFTLEGEYIGSKALETWRGVPHKISSTYDGRAVMVCSGRGVSFHLVSTIKPLYFIDEWQIGGDEEDIISAHDIDFGPSPSRPVVAVTGLSSGALRIHALKHISEWSEENKKSSVTEAVGNVIGSVKGTGSKVVGLVKGTGNRVLGLGKDIGRETIGDVASRGVSGFLGGLGLGK